MTITLGTQFQVDSDGDDLVRFVGLTSSTGIALYSSAANGIEARHLTNTGGTITGGTVLSIDGNQADAIAICFLTSSTVLIGYAYGTTHRTRILTVTGTTLSASAVKNMTDTGVAFIDCKLLDTDKVIYVYSNSALDGVARVLSITGVTISEGASFTYYNANDAYHNTVDIYSTIQAVVCWVNSGNLRVRAELLDISGTTITGNTEDEAPAGVVGSASGDHQVAMARQTTFPEYMVVVAVNGVATGRLTTLENQGGGTLNFSGSTLLNSGGGAANSVDIAHVCSDGSTNDYNIIVLNDTGGPNLWISEYDWFTGTNVDTDTSISTVAATSSVNVGLLGASSTAIAVWEATTEAITISIDDCPLPSLTLADMTKPADIDAAGQFIYLALLDGGTPILTKIATDLLSDGTTVFDPGSGDNIGVQCGKFDSNVIWVAGNFGGTDVVEKSEDAGASFTVKDPATFDPVTSFVVGPDSDDRVLVFTDAGGSVASSSVHETTDSGANWDQKDSGIGFVTKAADRLDINNEEIVMGNEASATDNIDYSPNTGQDQEDYSTGFPSQNVTGVIVG